MIHPLLPPSNGATLALANPLAGADKELAAWFHVHLSQTFITALKALTELGSGEWIGIALGGIILFLLWKRSWLTAATMTVAVPGGMLLNEFLKLEVHRHRPFFDDPFGSWSGYSFASGHTIGATLLYGQLALLIMPALKSREWRVFTVSMMGFLVLVVGFTRIALGAHYLTDVLGGIMLGIFWLAFCFIAEKPLRRNFAVVRPLAQECEINSRIAQRFNAGP